MALCALVYLAEASAKAEGERRMPRDNNLPPEDSHVETGGETATPLRADVEKWEEVVQRMRDSKRADIESRVLAVLEAMLAVQPDAHPDGVYDFAEPAHHHRAWKGQVPTVKGDAARLVFNVDCSEINWAVVDPGIEREPSRVHDGRSVSSEGDL